VTPFIPAFHRNVTVVGMPIVRFIRTLTHNLRALQAEHDGKFRNQ